MTDLKQTQPAANAAPNKPEAKAAHPTAQPVAAATPKPEAASADKAKYDFVFQAVAYKSKDSADKLCERMEGEGLRTRMTIEKDVPNGSACRSSSVERMRMPRPPSRSSSKWD